MKKNRPTNLAVSVRQRLLDYSRKTHEDFQLVLTRYAIERLLFRLSQSNYRDQFILKGAMLFQLWSGGVHRATRDLDLLGQGLNTAPRLEEIFRDLCNVQVPDDALRFDAKTVHAGEIKPDDEYQGIHVSLECRLENARIHLQIDIGFGDIVTPAPTEISFPTVLSLPAPILKAYPKESVIAEKLQAMVVLSIANSRMKDFYDLFYLANTFDFDGALLAEAVSKTFKRRKTTIPQDLPMAPHCDSSCI